MTESDRRREAEFFADLWHRNGFAVAWTAGKDGPEAKQVVKKGWNKTAPIGKNQHGVIAAELKRHNPALVAGQSGLVAIDCDSEADVARFRGFGPPPTMSWKTRQGQHFVYRAPAGAEFAGIYFEAGSITPKRECYLVMPPAIHPSGQRYELLTGKDGKVREIAELPVEVYQAMLAAGGAQRKEDVKRVKAGGKVKAGDRHTHLQSLTGRLRRDGVPLEAALVAVHATNLEACDPPKSQKEVERIVRSSYDAYDPELPGKDESKRPKPKTRTLHGVEPELTRWFPGDEFTGIAPRHGQLCAVVGGGGVGKGLWLQMLAASLMDTVTGPMLYLGEEDGDHQLAMRMAAAECPPENFHILDRITFPSGLDDFEEAIRDTGAKVAVIDSGAGHLDAGIKNNAVEDVRSVLDLLAAMAARTRCTIFVVVHVGKNVEMAAKSRGLGSSAWTDAVRHQLTMALDPEDDSRVIEVTKSNIGPTGTRRRLVQEMVPVNAKDPITGEWEETEFPRLVDRGPSMKSVEELLAHKPNGKEPHARRMLEEGLKARPGGWNANEAKKEIAMEVDCSAVTVWRAFKQLEREELAQAVQPGANKAETYWLWTGDSKVDKSGGWDG